MSAAATRVLFVSRTTAHLAYYETILTGLLGHGAEVELVFDRARTFKSKDPMIALEAFQAAHPALKTGWSVPRSDRRRDRVFALRELRSYRSYLARPRTTPFYTSRWASYLTPGVHRWVASRLVRRLLRSRVAGVALNLVERLTPPDPGIVRFIRERRPDVLVVSPLNMRFSEETDYVKAARRLGIPTALPVYSWDNLTTKGLIHLHPDRVFAWNDDQVRELREIHRVRAKAIRVAGAPFFDKWFEPPEDLQDRAAFCRAAGLDPSRGVLLYLGSSANIAKDETWFVEALEAALKAADDPGVRALQILIRPHPANAKIYAPLAARGLRVWPEHGSLPDTAAALADLRNSFHHAVAAVGINTSGMIDAVLADLPTFSVRIGRYDATQADTPHFELLSEGGAIGTMDSLAELTGALAEVLAGADSAGPRRRDFARRFARPLGADQSAGEAVAQGVLDLAPARKRRTVS